MKPYRRFQVRVPYWYCTECPEASAGNGAEEAARAHMDETLHEVRVADGPQVILRPPVLEEVPS